MNLYQTATPWGKPQDVKVLDEGIIRFHCAGHGGYFVSEARLAEMPEALRCGEPESSGSWFEEDEEWAQVALSFPNLFPVATVTSAESTLRNWRPNQWEKWTGKKLTPAESVVRREEAFYVEHRNDLIVLTAWGSWHRDVPDGMVGVSAMRGGRRFPTDEAESYWLVPEGEYSTRPNDFVAFVVDENRHTRMSKAIGL